jgi:hypothetical protein
MTNRNYARFKPRAELVAFDCRFPITEVSSIFVDAYYKHINGVISELTDFGFP